MMRNHLLLFITEEIFIFSETLFKILVITNNVKMSKNNIDATEIVLNILSALSSVVVDIYICYLMITLCTPED